MTGLPFENVLILDSHRSVLVKRVVLALAAILVSLSMASGWRAWFQMRSLKLSVSATTLTSGSTLVTDAVSYARVPIDVRVEIIQETHAETLGQQTVPNNWNAAFNPLTRRASQTIVVTPEVLARFAPGPAVVRAPAIGRPQWLTLF